MNKRSTWAFHIIALAAFVPLAFNIAIAEQPEAVIYSFAGGSDGAAPLSRLTPDAGGNFYGTTEVGGIGDWTNGYGTVFELSPDGSGGWTETVLYSFTGGADGANPLFSYVMFDSAGNLYGTTASGGTYGNGVVFELSPAAGDWVEKVLYSFTGGSDGANPVNGVIMDSAGNIYGKTRFGGEYEMGTTFELSPSGSVWTEQTIYVVGTNGTNWSGLTMDSAGDIFGTTLSSVFELTPNGSGGWNPSVIHTFPGDPQQDADTQGTLALDQQGNLYGTTTYDSGGGNGTVYELSPGTKGKWSARILHSFKGYRKGDGSTPYAGVTLDGLGNIYGTTYIGGAYNYGTIFEVSPPIGKGDYKERVLFSFDITNGDAPDGGVTLDAVGNLYGTTEDGGSAGGYGVVFQLNSAAPVTTNTVASSQNPSNIGETVVFTSVVTPAPPNGEIVTFLDGETTIGTASLSSGSATFETSTLPLGTSKVSAVYGGDWNCDGSTSKVLKQVVKK